MKSESAFSGLEAAIVLIAFVVVAAVFSYVMLGAGFFATQKSQEVTYSGIKQSTSNLVIDGTQYGSMGATTNSKYLVAVVFYLAVPQGGQPQSITDIDYAVTVNDKKYNWMANPPSGTGKFSVTPAGTDASKTIIKAGETCQMKLLFPAASTTGYGPAAGDTFTLEVRPKVGASSLLTKSLVTGYKGGVII